MRPIVLFLAAFALIGASPLAAQDKKKKEKPPIAKINEVRVGFRSNNPNDGTDRYKVGLWAPVYVTITAGEEGLPLKGGKPCFLQVETIDSEDVGTVYKLEKIAIDANTTQTSIAYVKTGNIGAEVKVTFNVDGRVFTAPPKVNALELNKHLYLTLGSRLPDMEAALASFFQQEEGRNIQMIGDPSRFAAFESEYSRLPDLWIGYQGVDLVILTTENKKGFLEPLATDKNPARLKALAQWVRRGGRLVISVAWQNQDLVAKLLENAEAWQPPVPVIPPAAPGDVKANAVKQLDEVAQFASVQLKPFPDPGDPPVLIAQLSPPTVKPGDWTVFASTADGRPLLARMPYGLGSITLIAFSLDRGPFTRWSGRAEFLKALLTEFAPRSRNVEAGDGRFGGRFSETPDLTTGLHRELEKYDVQMVPFGWVALFIVLYIIVVGPLDYLILRFVLKKLEWTWFTFPTVVLGVSVAAYFTAYALKGEDMKINKVDIVDFDLRTNLDAERKPARAYAYGQTFFNLLSPRIQNYTVGIEPNPVFWGGTAGKPVSADEVSWLGRPNIDQPGGMGRASSQALFRRPYRFADDATGVIGVPIPVWTTKSFNAHWEMPLEQLPFLADLVYRADDNGKDLEINGTLQSHLPVSLDDVWLFYGGRCFPIEGGLPGKAAGGKALEVKFDTNRADGLRPWRQAPSGNRRVDNKSIQDPIPLVRWLLFHEDLDVAANLPNHSARPLDLSWRFSERKGRDRQGGLREAILVARVAFRHGALQEMTRDAANPLPTKLWLGDLPAPEATLPSLQGRLYQDTFIRVLLPVRAAK